MSQSPPSNVGPEQSVISGPFGVTEREFDFSGDDRAKKPENTSAPPGFESWSIPHILTFSGLIQIAAKAYSYSFDEALRQGVQNAIAMRRDPVIFSALRARQIPVTQLNWKLEMPIDEDDPAFDKLSKYTKLVEKCIRKVHSFNRMLLVLQEAIWYGKSAVHVQYEWKLIDGRYILGVKRWYPINGDKIRYKWDGTVGIQTFPAKEFITTPTDYGVVHWIDQQERDQFIINNYEPEDPDFTEGLMSGSIFGVGLRSRLYWLWYLKSMVMGYLIAYLERVGVGGITIFFYEADNQRSFQEVKNMVMSQANQHVMLMPRNRDGSQGGPGVMRLENTGPAIAMFQNLVNQYFDNLIQQLILGQTLTYSTGTATRGVAELHADTFYRLVKHDSLCLQESLTRDLVYVIFKYSFPEIHESLYPAFKFSIDPPNAPQLLQYAQVLSGMGMPVDEEQLRDITGILPPRRGEKTANVNMSPYMPSSSAIPFLNEIMKGRKGE